MHTPTKSAKANMFWHKTLYNILIFIFSLQPAYPVYKKSMQSVQRMYTQWCMKKIHLEPKTSTVGIYSSKLWPYTGNWAKSRGCALFCKQAIFSKTGKFILVPRFSDLERDCTCQKTQNEQLSMFVSTHTAVGKLLVCRRKLGML